jgi:hypothetical protein
MSRKLLFLCVLIYGLSSCSSDDDEPGALNSYDRSVIDYFSEVALGFEFGGGEEITRKWNVDMKIFVGGNKKAELMTELQSVITEINGLATDAFNMSIVADSLQSNFYIFLGTGDDYGEKYPLEAHLVSANYGLFAIYWDASNHFYNGHMYVDIVRAEPAAQRHLLREELTQSLGLAKDSPLYPKSIFQSAWTLTTTYEDIDRDLIRLLYHPQMQVGWDETKVKEVLTQIILSEK